MPPLTDEEKEIERAGPNVVPREKYIDFVERNPGLEVMPAWMRQDLPKLKKEQLPEQVVVKSQLHL